MWIISTYKHLGDQWDEILLCRWYNQLMGSSYESYHSSNTVRQLEEIDNKIDSMVVLSWEIIKGEQIRTSNVSPLMYNQIDLRLKVSDHTWWVDMMNNPLIQPFHSFQIKYTPSSSEWSLFTSAINQIIVPPLPTGSNFFKSISITPILIELTHLLEFLQKNKIV